MDSELPSSGLLAALLMLKNVLFFLRGELYISGKLMEVLVSSKSNLVFKLRHNYCYLTYSSLKELVDNSRTA